MTHPSSGVEAVLRVGVGRGAAMDQCHEVLKLVVDTWSNIEAIPFRCSPSDDIGDSDCGGFTADLTCGDGSLDCGKVCFRSVEALVGFAWPPLLARAASSAAVDDGTLLQLIKDAVDHGVSAPHTPSEDEEELGAGHVGAAIIRGRGRLGELFTARKAEWSTLRGTRVEYAMRPGIDRRFDGPKDQRTRNFSDSEDDGCGNFDIISHLFARTGPLSPRTRCVVYSTWRPCLLDGNCCLRSDVVPNFRLQVRLR